MKHFGGTLGTTLVLCLLMAIPASAQPGPAATDRIMISVQDADVKDVIQMLMKGYQVPVAMSGEVQGRVTLHMADAPVEQVLNAIAELSDLEWRKVSGVYVIQPRSEGTMATVPNATEPSATAPLPVPVVPTTLKPVAPPVIPPSPTPSVTRRIRLKYAWAQDIAYLFGFSASPRNASWLWEESMFEPLAGDANIRVGPYYERTYTLGRQNDFGYNSPWSRPSTWAGPGSMMYPQLPPPPPPTPPTGPGEAPGGAGAGAGGPLSALRPVGIDLIVGVEALNLLLVRGDEEAIRELESIIREFLDVKPKQVTIETQFLEISTKKAKSLGIDWSFVSNDLGISTVGMTTPGNISVSYAHGDFSAVLSALEDSSVGTVINAPKVTTMNNFPAQLTIDEDFPFFESTVVQPGITGAVAGRTLAFATVSTSLYIIPRINEDDSITTLIQPQVSDVIKLIQDPESGGEVPQISSRSLSTMLRVNDGETIVMGGLVTRKASRATTRIPLLGRIPILGDLLFTRRTTSMDDTQLLIFLTPHVLHEEEEMVPTPGGVVGP